MKLIFSVMLLVLAVAAFALNPAEAALADSLAAHFSPANNLAIELQANYPATQLEAAFKQALLQRGAKLFSQVPANGTLLVLKVSSATIQQATKGWFASGNSQLTSYQAVLECYAQPSGQLTDVFNHSTSHLVEQQTPKTVRWYDPVLITTVIGGLIYLFYYGNN